MESNTTILGDVQTLGAVLLIALLAVLAVKVKVIDVLGALAGSPIIFVAFLAGGFGWLLVFVAFFVVSSLLTRFRYGYKMSLGAAQEKGGKRSWTNTIANGSVAALAAGAELYFHQEVFAVAFLASVAAATSDTVATEVGLLSGSKPRAITDLRRVVEPGTSGGVSLLGELAAIGSSIGIAILGLLLHTIPLNTESSLLPAAFISVVVGSLFGTNFDSLLGGTIQGVRRCQVCGALTESRNHHNEPTKLDRGSRFVDNNVVNFVAILAGTATAMLAFTVF